MSAPAQFPRAGVYAAVDRRLAGRVLLGVALLGAVAVTGPLISYRSDVEEVHRVFQARLARESHVYAAALASHFRMLEAELERLAARPEINPFDNSFAPEQELLAFTHHDSALFSAVAVLDAQGHRVGAEPAGAFAQDAQLANREWFQHVLAFQRPLVSALASESSARVVAVPVIRERRTVGLVVGLVESNQPALPDSHPGADGMDLVVLDKGGNIFLPLPPPAWAKARSTQLPKLASALLAAGGGRQIELQGREHYAAAARVGDTGLSLVLAADEASIIAPMRERFLYQLFTILVLQGLTVLLFAFYLQRTYRTFLDMESRAAQQEKMAALGSAASLIAHEVKNSLNGLKGAASLLASLLEGTADAALPIKSMRSQIDRLAHLASSLLHFGKPAAAQRVPTELGALVRDVLESLRALPEAEEVKVTTRIGDSEDRVLCDPLLLMTALDNLIRNAVEAAAVAKDLGKVRTPEVRVDVLHAPPYARIQVEDNAGGPPDELEARLFQPFVTGKPKGIGLGLSMARQALEQQGGELRYERTTSGSRFTLEVPDFTLLHSPNSNKG